jgi:hypothetical protein
MRHLRCEATPPKPAPILYTASVKGRSQRNQTFLSFDQSLSLQEPP